MDVVTLTLAKNYTNSVALGDGAIQGPPGPPGSPGNNGTDGLTPKIGANGNWWIGTSDTGIPAKGRDGETPEFRMNGNTLQYRFPNITPTVWTDLYSLPDTYKHVQNTASAVWIIPHNLNFQFVGVRVNDFEGNILIPDIEYTSANVVTLTFFMPVQGTATIAK